MITDKHTAIRFYGEKAIASLFETVKLFVETSGGDGDGWVVSDSYRVLADLFEEHEALHPEWHYGGRHEFEGCISFRHGQESIAFVDSISKLPTSWAGDIVVYV